MVSDASSFGKRNRGATHSANIILNRRSRQLTRRLSSECLERRELFAITPLVISSDALSLPDPTAIVALPDRLVFPRRTDAIGNELWTVETTPSGPALSSIDLQIGPIGSSPQALTVVGDKTFFIAEMQEPGDIARAQLYQTDGTPNGTVRLTQFRATAQGAQHPLDPASTSNQQPLPKLANGLLVINTGISRLEMWSQPIDGSDAIELTAGFSVDSKLGLYGVTPNYVLFEQVIDFVDRRLWISDGSAEGTHLVQGYEQRATTYLPQIVKETPQGIYILHRGSIHQPNELGLVSSDGHFTLLSGPTADPNASGDTEINSIIETGRGTLIDAGPAGWWIQTIEDTRPIEQSDAFAEVSIASSNKVVTFDPSQQGRPLVIDRQTQVVLSPDWPSATSTTSLGMLGGRLVYESPVDDPPVGNTSATREVRMIAVDPETGIVQELARYGITDSAEFTILNSTRAILEIERGGSRVIQRVDAHASDPLTLAPLISINQSISPVAILDDSLLTYRNVGDLQELVRVNFETFAIETLLKVTVPDALKFFGIESIANRNLNVDEGREFQFMVISPSGIHELWVRRGAVMEPVVRLPKGSSFALPRSSPTIWQPDHGDASTFYYEISGAEPGIARLRLSATDARWSFVPGNSTALGNQRNWSRMSDGTLVSDGEAVLKWQNDADLPTEIIPSIKQSVPVASPDSFSVPRLFYQDREGQYYVSDGTLAGTGIIDSVTRILESLGTNESIAGVRFQEQSGALFAIVSLMGVNQATSMPTILVERPGQTGLRVMHTAAVGNAQTQVYRISTGWLAVARVNGRVAELIWWGDGEVSPKSIAPPNIGSPNSTINVSLTTSNAVILNVRDTVTRNVEFFAIGSGGMHSLADSFREEIRYSSPKIVGHVAGDPLIRIRILNRDGSIGNDATVRWNLSSRSVSWVLDPGDDGVSERILATSDSFVIDRDRVWLVTTQSPSHLSHNAAVPGDVNLDGVVSALDALNVINWLRRRSNLGESVSAGSAASLWKLDVSDDGRVSALDALMIINALARNPSSQRLAPQSEWYEPHEYVWSTWERVDDELLSLF